MELFFIRVTFLTVETRVGRQDAEYEVSNVPLSNTYKSDCKRNDSKRYQFEGNCAFAMHVRKTSPSSRNFSAA